MNSRMPRSIVNCVFSERDQRLKAAFKIYGTTAASDLVQVSGNPPSSRGNYSTKVPNLRTGSPYRFLSGNQPMVEQSIDETAVQSQEIDYKMPTSEYYGQPGANQMQVNILDENIA